MCHSTTDLVADADRAAIVDEARVEGRRPGQADGKAELVGEVELVRQRDLELGLAVRPQKLTSV